MRDIGTLLGLDLDVDAYGKGINNKGQIVGNSNNTTPDGSAITEAYIWDSVNGMRPLPPYDPTAPDNPTYINSNATALNDGGVIVGYSATDRNHTLPVFWNAGDLKPKPQPLAFTFSTKDNAPLDPTMMSLNAINAGGLVVGLAFFPEFDLHGNVYDDSFHAYLAPLGGVATNIHSLSPRNGSVQDPLLPFTFGISEALGVNASGTVVGYSQTLDKTDAVGQDHAFIYQGGPKPRDLGALGGGGSHALAINDSNQIVGWNYSNSNAAGFFHAAMWVGSQETDLNTLVDPNSGWTLEEATSINNSGLIVGFGYINGMERGFLLSQAPVINAQKAGRARPAVHGVRFGRAARHQR